VLAYNRPGLLKNCLTALEAQTLAPTGIIVVDNGSEDSTVEMIGRFPAITHVRLEENTGSAAGYATAIAEASRTGTEWIWLLDDDAEPDPDCLRILREASRTLPDSTILVAPLSVGGDGKVQEFTRGSYSHIRGRQTPAVYTSGIAPIGYCSWSGQMLRTKLLSKVGPPRSEFFYLYEDVEYSLRLGKEGSMYLVPDARMVHHSESQGRRSWRFSAQEFWKLYYASRNRLLLLRILESSVWKRALGYLIAIYHTLRPVLAHIAFRPPQALARIRLLMGGLIAGLRGETGKTLDPMTWIRKAETNGWVRSPYA
jgi:GT2 family glycosyltransferase